MRAAAPWLSVSVLCTAVIAWHNWEPWADQLALLRSFEAGGAYPGVSSGIMSGAFAALATLGAGADLQEQNGVLRVAAALFYVGAVGTLVTQQVRPQRLRWLAALLVLSSLYPFVWLSSELVAGGALVLCVAGCLAGWSSQLLGALCAGLAFCKPDLWLVALALLAWRTSNTPARRERTTLWLAFGAACTVFVLPGVVGRGPGYLWESGRSWASFAQHAHILYSGRWEWEGWQARADQYFPGAHSVLDVVREQPALYVEFVRLSAQRGARSILTALGALVWTVPVMLAWAVARRPSPAPLLRVAALTLVGVLPWLLLSFPHVRYLARYFPLFVCGLAAFLAHVEAAGGQVRPPLRIVTLASCWGCAAVYVLVGIGSIAASFALPSGTVFWGAD